MINPRTVTLLGEDTTLELQVTDFAAAHRVHVKLVCGSAERSITTDAKHLRAFALALLNTAEDSVTAFHGSGASKTWWARAVAKVKGGK